MQFQRHTTAGEGVAGTVTNVTPLMGRVTFVTLTGRLRPVTNVTGVTEMTFVTVAHATKWRRA